MCQIYQHSTIINAAKVHPFRSIENIPDSFWTITGHLCHLIYSLSKVIVQSHNVYCLLFLIQFIQFFVSGLIDPIQKIVRLSDISLPKMNIGSVNRVGKYPVSGIYGRVLVLIEHF
ncbi:hypothetical protein SDC9_195332 [bioreactor metagenome]|uniref:Uncharacterized protein n=1 Tax=bioreactor metagenome TaxID=1076179 RepID=A0A645I913_9ZZZZ